MVEGMRLREGHRSESGAALLQGRAVCGLCGRHLWLRYTTRRGRQEAWYVCDRAQGVREKPCCQSIAGALINEGVGALVAVMGNPAAAEWALEIRAEIESRRNEADRLRLRDVERAQYAADPAQRRFMLVDPNNRLVADTLEHEWNDTLTHVGQCKRERERSQQKESSRSTMQSAIDSSL